MPTAISTTFGFFHMAVFSFPAVLEQWLQRKYGRGKVSNQSSQRDEWHCSKRQRSAPLLPKGRHRLAGK